MKKRFLSMLMVIVMVLIAIPTAASAAEYTFGDVDGNGDITAGDALLALQQAVQKITLSAEQQTAADVDLNGEVTANDALMILQDSVGKIVLEAPSKVIIDDYADYQYKYVEPTGLTEYTMYTISSGSCFTDQDTKRNHDLTRLAVCIQGLINRNNDKHHVAINIRMDSTDDFWLDYMSESGATYDGYTQVRISSTADMLDTFKAFITQCGIVAWDPNVPSTANVASTICGLYNYLPVQYSTADGSLYKRLTEEYNIPVKLNLCNKFEDAKLGEKIKDTNLNSTGSSKCDAYIWALDQYMEQCNPELLAYTPDGASAVVSNPVAQRGDAGSAQTTGIPNHDYFIAKQCFFFDLTSYGGEAPSDDLTQPLGTDAATLKKIMQKRYDMTGGMYGIAIGFPPWHLKYTRFISADYDMDPARLEWHFVEFCTSMNMGIEADAAHPCWMSNGSLYTKYQRRYEPKGNTAAKKVTYDPNTYYYTIVWSGDFDCSPWMKARIPSVWGTDTSRGTVAMTYGYNVNLVQRIPMAFDYIYENQTPNDYIVGGEGMGYIMPSALFKGFVGNEADPQISGPSGFYGTNRDSVVYRTLPDGDDAYYNYAKSYYDKLKVTITARLINGFSIITPEAMAMYNKLSPGGTFVQSSTAGPYDLTTYEGTPYMRIFDMGGSTNAEKAAWVYNTEKDRDTKFLPFSYCDTGANYGTVSGFKAFLQAVDDYTAEKDPGTTYQYLDINTFVDVVRQSGLGTVATLDE